ncbi:MAG: response regulator [Betaproteobacteria bacterium]|nr:response regulator [Betaproteobacteria bacterium]
MTGATGMCRHTEQRLSMQDMKFDQQKASGNTGKKTYQVAVVGFSQTERLVLGGIFGLAARREPSFVPFQPGTAASPDLFLVDADDQRCPDYLRAIPLKSKAPILLVGATAHGTAYPVMARPLMWTRTLQQFEQTVRSSANAVAKPKSSDWVLVVDDSLAVRKFMEAKLAPFGFNVDYAESGERAIGLTGEKQYTCVFLDVILPGVDGYQVCKMIKSMKSETKRTAVVMLTSKSSPFDRIRGTMAGCDAYLTKPVDEEKLLAVIAKFLPVAGSVGAGEQIPVAR